LNPKDLSKFLYNTSQKRGINHKYYKIMQKRRRLCNGND